MVTHAKSVLNKIYNNYISEGLIKEVFKILDNYNIYAFNEFSMPTSGCPTNPKSWGRIDLLVNLMVVFVDSYIVQQPKSISCTSNSMSELVTTAWTVKGTGAVWSATRIIIGASSTPVSLSKYLPASSNKLGLKREKVLDLNINHKHFHYMSFTV